MPHEQPAPELRDETMLYREPTADSDDAAVADIWGKQLETRVVESSSVPGLLAEGWVQHPLDLGKKPEEIEGFKRDAGKTGKELEQTRLALDTAEKLVGEQEQRLNALTTINLELHAERDQARADQKAAEDLADAETKAKDDALAELQAIKDKQVKTTGKG